MEFRQAMHIAIRHEFVHQVGERVAWSGGPHVNNGVDQTAWLRWRSFPCYP
jgi:hypothetical protein